MAKKHNCIHCSQPVVQNYGTDEEPVCDWCHFKEEEKALDKAKEGKD